MHAVQGRGQLSHWSVDYFQSRWLDSPWCVDSGSCNPHTLDLFCFLVFEFCFCFCLAGEGLSDFIAHVISVNLMSLNIPFTHLKLAAYRSISLGNFIGQTLSSV